MASISEARCRRGGGSHGRGQVPGLRRFPQKLFALPIAYRVDLGRSEPEWLAVRDLDASRVLRPELQRPVVINQANVMFTGELYS